MPDNRTVYIFWTGGWDSTYRMVELSRADVIVHPIYCLDPKRKSQSIELEHMNEILELLRKKPETKATLFPIEKIEVSSLPPDLSVKNAWNEIIQTIRLGTQYLYLPLVAKKFPGIEMGIEDPGKGKIIGANGTIKCFGKLVEQNGTFVLDKEATHPACYTLFGQISFPIIHMTELKMLQNIRKWGYEDVMRKIWFCYCPVKEQIPCGVCRPCQEKIESHMEFLLDKPAKIRYKILCILSKVLGRRIASKMIRVITGLWQ